MDHLESLYSDNQSALSSFESYTHTEERLIGVMKNENSVLLYEILNYNLLVYYKLEIRVKTPSLHELLVYDQNRVCVCCAPYRNGKFPINQPAIPQYRRWCGFIHDLF